MLSCWPLCRSRRRSSRNAHTGQPSVQRAGQISGHHSEQSSEHIEADLRGRAPPIPSVELSTEDELTQEECAVCLEPFGKGPVTSGLCTHVFHTECVRKWLNEVREHSCPFCRSMYVPCRFTVGPQIEISREQKREALLQFLRMLFVQAHANVQNLDLTRLGIEACRMLLDLDDLPESEIQYDPASGFLGTQHENQPRVHEIRLEIIRTIWAS